MQLSLSSPITSNCLLFSLEEPLGSFQYLILFLVKGMLSHMLSIGNFHYIFVQSFHEVCVKKKFGFFFQKSISSPRKNWITKQINKYITSLIHKAYKIVIIIIIWISQKSCWANFFEINYLNFMFHVEYLHIIIISFLIYVSLRHVP